MKAKIQGKGDEQKVAGVIGIIGLVSDVFVHGESRRNAKRIIRVFISVFDLNSNSCKN